MPDSLFSSKTFQEAEPEEPSVMVRLARMERRLERLQDTLSKVNDDTGLLFIKLGVERTDDPEVDHEK